MYRETVAALENQYITEVHRVLHLAKYQRAFVVSDIHGCFDLLNRELNDLNFNPPNDVLISVGDLTDRGPDSLAALKWVTQPWFYRVLGNHEVFLDDYLKGQLDDGFIRKCGGQWFLDLSKADQIRVVSILMMAPYALTVVTPGRRKVGIAHADCLRDWDRHVAQQYQSWNKLFATQSRESIKGLMLSRQTKQPFDPDSMRVTNVDHVFHGHTILDEVTTVANRTWIDTGAYKTGHLTVFDIDDFLDG